MSPSSTSAADLSASPTPITVAESITTRFDHHIVERSLDLHGMRVTFRMVEAPADKPRVVLIHGMAGSSRMWEPAMALLEGHASVLAVDLLGHGGSARGRSLDYSIGNQASIVRDVMVRLGFGAATIVGQSLGGGVAMQFAYQYPERTQRLVLVDAGGLGKEVSPILRFLSLPGTGLVLGAITAPPVLGVLKFWSKVGHTLGLRLAPEQKEMAAAYTSLADPATRRSFLQTLRSVVDIGGQSVAGANRLYLTSHMPVLVAWGDRDGIIPASHADRIAEVVPHARVEWFPGAGHFPHDSQPERFTEVVLRFIEETEPASIDADQLARTEAG